MKYILKVRFLDIWCYLAKFFSVSGGSDSPMPTFACFCASEEATSEATAAATKAAKGKLAKADDTTPLWNFVF